MHRIMMLSLWSFSGSELQVGDFVGRENEGQVAPDGPIPHGDEHCFKLGYDELRMP